MILLIFSAIAFSVSFVFEAPVWYIIIYVVLWLAITLSFCLLPVQYVPTKFSVPLKPFTPCLGVLATIHLIGSLGLAAYVRFFVWFVLCLGVYLFYGMQRAEAHEQLSNQLKREDEYGNGVKNGGGSGKGVEEGGVVELSSRVEMRKSVSKGGLLDPGLPSSSSARNLNGTENSQN
eukprot:TRINITY_DN34215_c0_g1_i1.p2 TRINITY_DN34215_c0_g1~~TRINITY_DN34215_c0_g1_i1.p2  ORF type:complete len:176 (+),score=30.05 TRINITY_DN34215_c0_g1_i1:3-530(+)